MRSPQEERSVLVAGTDSATSHINRRREAVIGELRIGQIIRSLGISDGTVPLSPTDSDPLLSSSPCSEP